MGRLWFLKFFVNELILWNLVYIVYVGLNLNYVDIEFIFLIEIFCLVLKISIINLKF